MARLCGSHESSPFKDLAPGGGTNRLFFFSFSKPKTKSSEKEFSAEADRIEVRSDPLQLDWVFFPERLDGRRFHPPPPVLILSLLPPFQGLVGEKYGSIRVPGEVESAEFEMILDAAVEAGLDTHILEEWYCRDENSVPPAYYLKPKAQMLKNFQNSVSPRVLPG